MEYKIKVFTFKGYTSFYWNDKGQFFELGTEKPIPQKFYDGSLCIVYKKRKHSLTKLKKKIVKSTKIVRIVEGRNGLDGVDVVVGE